MKPCPDALAVETGARHEDCAALARLTGSALVIDDHPCVRTLIAWALADEGLTVAEAVGGEDGVAQAEAQQPELILVDLDMPGGGLGVVARLRAAAPSAMVVALTDCDRSSLRDAVFAEGGDDLLEKPFHLDELRAIVACSKTTASQRASALSHSATFVDSL